MEIEGAGLVPEDGGTERSDSYVDDELRERRIVYANDPEANAKFHFCGNKVVTSKYTVINFLPKFLFESFQKLANGYFLFVSILQCIPSISNTGGLPTTLPVLVFILAVDGVFAVMDDIRRHRADRLANAASCHIVEHPNRVTVGLQGHAQTPEYLRTATWTQIRVGDIIKVHSHETIPADVLLLSCAEIEGEPVSGVCYVETKSLDGETNLKLRQAMRNTMNSVDSPAKASQLRAIVECETPNPNVGKFSGTFQLVSCSSGILDSSEVRGPEEKIPVGPTNLLLRGCVLRNTDFVYGLVVNTGPDTKIMQSASETPMKWSRINHIINSLILVMVTVVFILCGVAATLMTIWNDDFAGSMWYLDWGSYDKFGLWVQSLFFYFLLTYQLIPVSLYVTVAMTKFLQAMFMMWDVEMYDDRSDTPAIVRNMSLNEELGQISYMFTDKTGTLTDNIMEFRKCSISGLSYGKGTTEIGRAALARQGKFIPEDIQHGDRRQQPFVNFNDPELHAVLAKRRGDALHCKAHEFFLHLAICHTVIPEHVEGEDEARLSASSPDEQALVSAAKYFGFSFQSRGLGQIQVQVEGKRVKYIIEEVLEFTSERKRMSVIVRYPDGTLKLLSKGADVVMLPRCGLPEDADKMQIRRATEEHLNQFALEGLRTLVVASKSLNPTEYEKWQVQFARCNTDLAEVEKRKNKQPNKIDSMMDEIERGLTLLGGTAIEDKLQAGVPGTISDIRSSGIKIWVLTGDKTETATNIAYACQIIILGVSYLVLTTAEAAERLLDEYKNDLERTVVESSAALIIDGSILEMIFSGGHTKIFFGLASLCTAVVCCRVSPLQKAQVVSLVKEHEQHARTMAIGDGANDVAMIQKAHIGVGISGQEGMQAVNSSDFAIAQFRFLRPLLLHHGRQNYRRISRLVCYMFYKNAVLTCAQYYLQFWTGFSGQKYYNELGYQAFNVAYTSMPIIWLGVMDKDLPKEYSMRFPELYEAGPKDALFNYRIFMRWILAGIYEAAVIVLFSVFGYTSQALSKQELGVVILTLVVWITNTKICLFLEEWHWICALLWWLGNILWFPISVGVTSLWCSVFTDDCGALQNTATQGYFWLLIPVVTCVCLGRHYVWQQYQRLWNPKLNDVLQEARKLQKHIIKEAGEMKEVFQERAHSGYAFSFDEGSTLAESFIATKGQESPRGSFGLSSERPGSFYRENKSPFSAKGTESPMLYP